MIALVLQARLDSKRLPGKSLLPLEGRPLIFRTMEALAYVPADIRVLACPEDCAEEFKPLAEEAGFELLTGPKDDVLKRYCLAIRRYLPDRIIRATGDNPFVFADAADSLNREAQELQADYAGYQGLPHGSGVETVDSEALLKADREADSPADREHVCPYLYNNPDLFYLHRPLAPKTWQGLGMRTTVDTEEDYDRAQILYSALSRMSSGPERYMGEFIIDRYRNIIRKLPSA
jgi:spore coat polysaccharide biosynthesis protein SpsF